MHQSRMLPSHRPVELSRRRLLAAAGGAAAWFATSRLAAEEPDASETSAGLLQYEDPRPERWEFGVSVHSRTAACRGVYATFPVPRPWPEQGVELVGQELSPYVSAWQGRELSDGVREILVRMDQVPRGVTAEALFTFEVTRSRIVSTELSETLRIPARSGRDTRMFLGSSPYIDPRHPRIRMAANELEQEAPESAWEQVEQIYDWVREQVEYQEGDLKSAVDALKDGTGDCEELSSLFVALCRARRIPARLVWIPGHCYPEFYLESDDGRGEWFPCQAAGTRQFGSMDEYRPILQKGDQFSVPEKRHPVRYVAEFCRIDAVRGTGKPDVDFVRRALQDS